MCDTNEELLDSLLFWMSDPEMDEFVLRLEPDTYTKMTSDGRKLFQTRVDGKPLNKFESQHYELKPEDINIDELSIKELKGYTGEERESMAKAIAKEIHDLVSLGTFAWERLPDDRRAMSSKLVLKIKYKADGQLDKFKGRLVARGFEGRPGVDFFGTFAPMASITTVRTVFAIAVHHGLPIIHCDIPQAFLQANIDIPQYLMLPKGITVQPQSPFNYIDTKGWDNRVVKLLKSIYGLKSAPQLFNKLLNDCLTDKLGMTRGSSDQCLYHFANDDGWVLVCTEVDDLVVTGTNTVKIQQIHDYFVSEFKLKDWDDPIRSFLGINIDYDIKSGRFEMDIADKVKKTFEKHPILNRARPRKCPLPPKDDASIVTEEKPTELQEYIHDNYASIVGAFIYMSITCRPDISFAIGRVSRGMHKPERHHVKMLEHLCGYLKAYPGIKLIYQRTGNAIETHLSHLTEKDSALATLSARNYRGKNMGEPTTEDPMFGMTDSDYANTREDKRRSISGYCFFVYGCLVSWKSKLQPITAGSTHEAELIAMSFAADEAVWTRRLLLEIGFAVPAAYHVREEDPEWDPTDYADRKTERWIRQMRPTWLLGDNQSSIFTANNPETSQRSKHLEIRWFRVRDYIKEMMLQVRHIRTGDNVADFFTKALQGPEGYERFREFLMGRQDFSMASRFI